MMEMEPVHVLFLGATAFFYVEHIFIKILSSSGLQMMSYRIHSRCEGIKRRKGEHLSEEKGQIDKWSEEGGTKGWQGNAVIDGDDNPTASTIMVTNKNAMASFLLKSDNIGVGFHKNLQMR